MLGLVYIHFIHSAHSFAYSFSIKNVNNTMISELIPSHPFFPFYLRIPPPTTLHIVVILVLSVDYIILSIEKYITVIPKMKPYIQNHNQFVSMKLFREMGKGSRK